jgi:tetratricopeptide (TPR) repeat protein
VIFSVIGYLQQMKAKESAKELQSAQQALHRRLGPIQDAFYEQKNYKAVVKTCEASLKKDANQVWIKTYLAMAKQQLGEYDEALRLYDSLLPLIKPNDAEFVSRLLKQALDHSGQLELYVQALEAVQSGALKSGSMSLVQDSLKVETLLFHQYFRLGEFQKATKQAMRLRQLAGEDSKRAQKMLMWNIVATFWTYKTNGNAMSLTLTERMLGRLAEEGKLTSGEDVLLYCSVLKASGKAGEALLVARGTLGAKAFPFEEERLKLICSLAEASKDQTALRDGYLNVLRVSADDWDAWSGLIEASSGDLGSVLTVARESAASNPSKRGPRVAEIEVCARGNDTALLLSLLVSYFDTFGHKACCWGDVARYTRKLGSADREALLARMRNSLKAVDWETHYPVRDFSSLELEDPNDPHREKRDGRNLGKVDHWSAEDEVRQSEMMRRVAIAKLEITVAAAVASPTLIAELFRQHQAASVLYRKVLLETEEGPNDDLLIVAAHHLIQSGKSFDAMSMCVAGLENTPFAFQPKLQLIRLARKSGAYGWALNLFGKLECRHVQLDSMGHYALYPAVQSGDFGALEDLSKAYVEFRDATLKRTVPGDTSKCFSHERWSQVEEFLHFGNRVDGSWHASALQIETVLAGVCKAANAEQEVKSVLEHARKRGLVEVGSRKGLLWLENLIEICQTYKGKGDLRLVYNYDLRVQADFRQCLSKAEFLAAEWVVPSEMVDWLLGRALFVKLLEAAVNGDAGVTVATAERLVGMTDKLCNAQVLGARVSWDLMHSVLVATQNVCSCTDFAAGRDALELLLKALRNCISKLETEAPFPCLEEGWASNVSFVAFEIVPLIDVLSLAWRKLGQPSKSVKNKLDAAAKTGLSEQLTLIKSVTESAAELVKTLSAIARKRMGTTDDELLAFVSQSSVPISKVHLQSVCKDLNTSWKAWFGLLAQKSKE